MRYKVEIVRIHPFPDGNKRSTRGIVNYLLERAGLPPVYVKFSELEKYQEALISAMTFNDYQTITNFYKNKLCDSIEELVIDPFVFAINEYNKMEEEKEAKKQKGSNLVRLLKNEENKPKE
jgi:Fic family protein